MALCVVHATRDSVSAGDDIDAPHEFTFEIEQTASLHELFRQIGNARYLANVAGQGHHWHAAIGGELVATFSANNRMPGPSLRLGTPISQWMTQGKIDLNFTYVSATY